MHRLFLVALCGAVLAGCAGFETVPETGRQRRALQYSEAEMAQLGAEAYREVLREHEVIESGAEADMVREVGGKIAAVTGRDYEWQFALLDAPKTLNAFCLPGGKIAVFSGILPVCAGESGLAVVLGHEVAHATLQHGNERMSQGTLKTLIGRPLGRVTNLWGAIAPGSRKLVMDGLGLGAVFGRALPWNQEHEREADVVGLRYLRDAEYDVDEAPKFWQRMVEAGGDGGVSDSLSTHPAPADRIAALEAKVAAMKRGEKQP